MFWVFGYCFGIYTLIAIRANNCYALPSYFTTITPEVEQVSQESAEDMFEICTSPECITAANGVLENMDPDVNPCEDFYKFACGNFDKRIEIPDDESELTSFQAVEETLKPKLRHLLEKDIESDETEVFKSVKKVYNLCINEKLVEKQGIEELERVMKKLGDWPVLKGSLWESENFSWEQAMYNNEEMGYRTDVFVDFDIGPLHYQKFHHIVLTLQEPSLDISREYLILGFDNEIVQKYLEYMVDIAVFLGAEKNRAVEELKESLEFQIKLANISLSKSDKANFWKHYENTTLGELTKKHPNTRWDDYVQRLCSPYLNVSESTPISIQTKFMSDFEDLLQNTPKRVQANYAMWRIVQDSIPYLTNVLRTKQIKFDSLIHGITKAPPRWKYCVEIIMARFSMAVGAMYVRHYFHEEAKEDVTEIITDIQDAFSNILQKIEWMDAITKKQALQKVKAMNAFVAYPDNLLNDTNIEAYYEDLELNNGSYFEVGRSLRKFNRFTFFNADYADLQWLYTAHIVEANAFYSRQDNTMLIPAGILQGIFFDDNRPQYLNYAAIGFIIGHELSHGFDKTGHLFDEEGNYVDWWNPVTKSTFLEKTKCIIDQYENYTVSGVNFKLNGIHTQDENIADHGGYKAAYWAYGAREKLYGTEPRLPFVSYNNRQIFWISAANMWCSKKKPESSKNSVLTDAHSPPEFRINGAFSNLEEFAKDFQCPEGSNMNPTKKCPIW